MTKRARLIHRFQRAHSEQSSATIFFFFALPPPSPLQATSRSTSEMHLLILHCQRQRRLFRALPSYFLPDHF
eukprot:COSAG06_NODE_30639_length_535_cov_0.816514_2_plen_71_part_01